MKYMGESGLSKLLTLIKTKIESLTASDVGAIPDTAGAVTRDKLANDTLYSPRNLLSSDSYSIVASDLGKTIYPNNTLASSAVTVTLSQAVSATMPTGAEVALLWLYGNSFTLQSNGVRFAMVGESNYFKTGVSITERFGMIAIKKLAPDNTNGDLWLVQGLAEVVS